MAASPMIPGRLSIFVISAIVLLLQMVVECKNYELAAWLVSEQCGGAAKSAALMCLVPWQAAWAASAGHLGALLFGLFRYRWLGKTWWYVVLPLITVFCATVVFLLNPGIVVS